jgi:cytochrome P450
MSATSFGGSVDSVRTNDNYLKNLFIQHLQETAIVANFPFLKWLPFFRLRKTAEMDQIIDGIVSKRLSSKDQTRKDLLQIFLDTHKANPESFSDKHIKEEMRLFM